MRKTFFQEFYQLMKNNSDIYALTGDLGYGGFDKIRDEFPHRFFNIGAAEQTLIGIAIGLALKGKIPFVYSITPFLLWRPAETIRLYLNHEKIAVHLIGSGRDKDYSIDGISHDSSDVRELLKSWPNIKQYWPEEAIEIPAILEEMVKEGKPTFLSLRR
ncbi:MAG: hypothetical protein A2163_07870 [Actinobacteria bacterium RBG_13_35_12]|nr:MAG: hypothetical protein A2163_07870 [Actinobacteria bacterium RBG_13_35_12]